MDLNFNVRWPQWDVFTVFQMMTWRRLNHSVSGGRCMFTYNLQPTYIFVMHATDQLNLLANLRWNWVTLGVPRRRTLWIWDVFLVPTSSFKPLKFDAFCWCFTWGVVTVTVTMLFRKNSRGFKKVRNNQLPVGFFFDAPKRTAKKHPIDLEEKKIGQRALPFGR